MAPVIVNRETAPTGEPLQDKQPLGKSLVQGAYARRLLPVKKNRRKNSPVVLVSSTQPKAGEWSDPGFP